MAIASIHPILSNNCVPVTEAVSVAGTSAWAVHSLQAYPSFMGTSGSSAFAASAASSSACTKGSSLTNI